MDSTPAELWIDACAHRLQRQWRTVDPEMLEEVATDLWRDPRLRAMTPTEAAMAGAGGAAPRVEERHPCQDSRRPDRSGVANPSTAGRWTARRAARRARRRPSRSGADHLPPVEKPAPQEQELVLDCMPCGCGVAQRPVRRPSVVRERGFMHHRPPLTDRRPHGRRASTARP